MGRLGAADLRAYRGRRQGTHGSSSGATGSTARGRGPEHELSHSGGYDVGFDPVGTHGVVVEGGGFTSGFEPEIPKSCGKGVSLRDSDSPSLGMLGLEMGQGVHREYIEYKR